MGAESISSSRGAPAARATPSTRRIARATAGPRPPSSIACSSAVSTGPASTSLISCAPSGSSEQEAGWEGVFGVEEVLGGPGEPGSAGDRGDHRGDAPGQGGLVDETPGERRADEGLVDEVGADRELAARVELGHPGAGAGAAGAPVEPAGMDGHG